MCKVIAIPQLNSFTAIRRSEPLRDLTHSRQMVITNAGAIFLPLARSFWGLGKSTERGAKQRAGKTVKTLYRGGRKARWLAGWRLIPVSGQAIDRGRHGQQHCLAVTTKANVGNLACDMEYLLGPRELSSLQAFPSWSLIHRAGEKQDTCAQKSERKVKP